MIKDLIEKRTKLLADYKSLQDEATKREWTNEDHTRADNMLAELESLDTQMDGEEKRKQRDDRFKALAERSKEQANKPAEKANVNGTDGTIRSEFRNYLRTGTASHEVRTNLSEGTNSAGGYLAPADLAQELLSIVIEQSNIRQKAKVLTTSLASIPVPYKSGGPTGAWVAEGGSITASQSTYASVSLAINKFAFNTAASFELLQDGLFDIESQILNDISIEVSRGENAGFIAGSGTHQPMGLITVASNGVTATNSGVNGSFVADDLINLQHTLKAPYIDTSEWFLNRSTFTAVAKMKTSGGLYVFAPMGYGLMGGAGATSAILGRPFNLSPDMPVSVLNGGSGTPLSVMYTNPAVSYRIVQKPLANLLTIVRDQYTQAANGLVVFWAAYRVGGNVVMPEAVAILKESA